MLKTVRTALSLYLFLFLIAQHLSCGEEWEITREVLKEVKIDGLTLAAVRECEPTALGGCDLLVIETSRKTFWSPDGECLLRCPSTFHDVEFNLLDSGLLLVGFHTGTWDAIAPHVIIPVGETNGVCELKGRSPVGHWDLAVIDENTIYSVETYRSDEDKGDFGLHMWQKGNSISHRNLYILDARNVICEFVRERVLKVSVDWGSKRHQDNFYVLLFKEGGEECKVFYDKLPDANEEMNNP